MIKKNIFLFIFICTCTICFFTNCNNRVKGLKPQEDSDTVSIDSSVVDTATVEPDEADTTSAEPSAADYGTSQSQTEEDVSPSASINNVWITSDDDYIYVHADFDVLNMAYKTGSFVVYIQRQYTQDPNSTGIYDYKTYTPSYKNSNFSNFILPFSKESLYNSLDFDNNIKIYVKICDDSNNELTHSDYVSFTL